MKNVSILYFDLIHPFRKKVRKIKDNYLHHTLIEFRVSVSFPTHFQVAFSDENGDPRIKECSGTSFEKQVITSERKGKLTLKAFVSNAKQLKDQFIQLSILQNGTLMKEIRQSIGSKEKYDGWFSLEL